MQINTKRSRDEQKRISNLNSQLKRSINAHRIEFSPEVFKKTRREKNLVKKHKKAWNERVKNR